MTTNFRRTLRTYYFRISLGKVQVLEFLATSRLVVWNDSQLPRTTHQRRIGREPLQCGQQLLDLLRRGHGEQAAAQSRHGLHFVLAHEQVFFAGAAGGEVDCGEEAAFGDLAIEDELHVAGAFELFEDDLVCRAAGIDEAGGDHGEAAGFFGVAGCAEDLAGDFEGFAVEAARHGAAAAGVMARVVERAAEAGERIHDDDDVPAALDERFAVRLRREGDLDVLLDGVVVAAGDDTDAGRNGDGPRRGGGGLRDICWAV